MTQRGIRAGHARMGHSVSSRQRLLQLLIAFRMREYFFEIRNQSGKNFFFVNIYNLEVIRSITRDDDVWEILFTFLSGITWDYIFSRIRCVLSSTARINVERVSYVRLRSEASLARKAVVAAGHLTLRCLRADGAKS